MPLVKVEFTDTTAVSFPTVAALTGKAENELDNISADSRIAANFFVFLINYTTPYGKNNCNNCQLFIYILRLFVLNVNRL